MSRTPTQAEPGRIAPLSVLPVFYRLNGKRAVVAGQSAGAAWKAELLAAAGAAVDVYAPVACDELDEVCARNERRIRRIARAWTASDVAGAAIAVADSRDDDEAQAFRDA